MLGRPEELATDLGLSAAAVTEWQVQYVLLKRLKEIAAGEKIAHAGYYRGPGGAFRPRIFGTPEIC